MHVAEYFSVADYCRNLLPTVYNDIVCTCVQVRICLFTSNGLDRRVLVHEHTLLIVRICNTNAIFITFYSLYYFIIAILHHFVRFFFASAFLRSRCTSVAIKRARMCEMHVRLSADTLKRERQPLSLSSKVNNKREKTFFLVECSQQQFITYCCIPFPCDFIQHLQQ